MNKLVGLLSIIFCLSGCAETYYNPATPTPAGRYLYGDVEYCDADGNCRVANDVYYYRDNALRAYYWDAFFGCWVGPTGAYVSGVWTPGLPIWYHNYYGRYFYRGQRFGRGGGWYGGGSFRGGGFRGGGGFHGGGHHR